MELVYHSVAALRTLEKPRTASSPRCMYGSIDKEAGVDGSIGEVTKGNNEIASITDRLS